ncbi:hypothetical protein F511_15217 [Dorcoceras hygrometricum]|uniref:Uncharacterized protein n=1 Tax=Dorcoceras hygrometricum TaxID=472368 RepID=A0A2Z7CB74_9LAMI|nr:hypothetical protein F511_15217 [Dorcoceras hygrometricum]
MHMLCKGSRLQPKAGSQRISTTSQQQGLIKGTISSGHGYLSTWELPTHLQYTIPDANNQLHLLLLTHDMWELPTPLIAANRPSREIEVRELPAQPPGYTGTTRSSLNIASCCKQAHIRTSSLLSYNYNKAECHNDPAPHLLNGNTTTAQRLKHSKATAGSYTQLALSYLITPQKALTSLKGGSELTAKRLERNPTLMPTDYTREMSSHTSPASSKRSKTISKQIVSARGVQRYHSRLHRSCLPPEIGEDKVRGTVSRAPGSDYFSNRNSTSLVAPKQIHLVAPNPVHRSVFQFLRWSALEPQGRFCEQNLLARTIAAKCDGGGGWRERRRGGEFAE